jgi:hypothetical protein
MAVVTGSDGYTIVGSLRKKDIWFRKASEILRYEGTAHLKGVFP